MGKGVATPQTVQKYRKDGKEIPQRRQRTIAKTAKKYRKDGKEISQRWQKNTTKTITISKTKQRNKNLWAFLSTFCEVFRAVDSAALPYDVITPTHRTFSDLHARIVSTNPVHTEHSNGLICKWVQSQRFGL